MITGIAMRKPRLNSLLLGRLPSARDQHGHGGWFVAFAIFDVKYASRQFLSDNYRRNAGDRSGVRWR